MMDALGSTTQSFFVVAATSMDYINNYGLFVEET